MKHTFTSLKLACVFAALLGGTAANAQTGTDASTSTSTSTEEFKPHGKLWGYAFGDFAFKGSADSVGAASSKTAGGRGGSNQYTKVPANADFFQFRRIYLGYNYEISKKFVAEFLLAAEDDFASNAFNGATGDLLQNNKFSPYVKLANVRWRNFWKNTDLVIGQSPTPTFAQGSALKEYARNTQTSEEVWGYRSIERTITDIRRTSSYDFGASLQGWFDNGGNYGYDLMVANGTGDKPEGDNFKWFYGDVYAKFFKKQLIVDLYQDYTKINWTPTWHHDRNMTKLFVAYQGPKLTVGVEAFQNTLLGDVAVTGTDKKTYYRTTKSTGVSVFAKGVILKDKLNFFARYDNFDPTGDLSEVTGNSGFTSYSASTSQYDPTTKEQFMTFGIDYTPVKNVHIMPNVWINTYDCGLSSSEYALNPNGTGVKGTDAVYRITFYYIYGK